MPLIQRNLFPSRPPSKKNDGPSILRANHQQQNLANQQQHTTTTIMNPILTMYTTANKLRSLDSSSSLMKNSKLYQTTNNNNKINQQNPADNNKKDAKKLRKSQSSSMISLLAINHPGGGGGSRKVGGGGGNMGTHPRNHNNNNNKINYDSQDSFNSSDASCSDPQSLCSSSSSVDNNMISRRRILSKSKDALNNPTSNTLDEFSNDDDGFNPSAVHQPSSIQQPQPPPAVDEDVWHNKHQLISDHIEEILTKWDQIDDEIWAKVICMERNRRVAKAYARAPILTINGYEAGFDGHRIGLNGFENPMRDRKTMDYKNRIEDGVKLRMDQDGSLLVKRLTDLDVFILSTNAHGFETSKPMMDTNTVGHKIEQRKSVVLFDMKQYQQELLREIKSTMPNLRLLEQRCFCFVSFGSYAEDLLATPVWCIIINLVALEMLVKLIPFRISDDNFYSLPLSLSSKVNGYFNGGFNNSMPPKLPPRDLHNKKPPLTLPEPDYEDDNTNNNDDDNGQNQIDDENDENVIRSPMSSVKCQMSRKIVDDPYYHGLSAHVPKFAHPIRQPATNNNLANHHRSQNNVQNNDNYNYNNYHNNGNNNYHHHHNPPPPIVRRAMNKKFWNYTTTTNNTSSGHVANGKHSDSASTFDPMRLLPTTTIVNDNNEIYGVNPSLLRNNKNRPFHVRSASQPSLKNIFSRKKSVNHNNNNNNNKD